MIVVLCYLFDVVSSKTESFGLATVLSLGVGYLGVILLKMSSGFLVNRPILCHSVK